MENKSKTHHHHHWNYPYHPTAIITNLLPHPHNTTKETPTTYTVDDRQGYSRLPVRHPEWDSRYRAEARAATKHSDSSQEKKIFKKYSKKNLKNIPTQWKLRICVWTYVSVRQAKDSLITNNSVWDTSLTDHSFQQARKNLQIAEQISISSHFTQDIKKPNCGQCLLEKENMTFKSR